MIEKLKRIVPCHIKIICNLNFIVLKLSSTATQPHLLLTLPMAALFPTPSELSKVVTADIM